MLEIHLTVLEDEECMWRPSSMGLHLINKFGVWQVYWAFENRPFYELAARLNLELMKISVEL